MQTLFDKTEIPKLARDEIVSANLFEKQAALPTSHKIFLGDARNLRNVEKESVHLIVTSPPYWTLKKYPDLVAQLGAINSYDKFLDELSKAISECYRVLMPGGRFVCVVGDICIPRRQAKSHHVYPLHSDITVIARQTGFQNLSPIFWYKISNARYEANTKSTILGKPYEPNAIIKNDVEFILIQRKPGPYRQPKLEQRQLSYIPRKYYENWFRQIWVGLRGESTRHHPAPYPLELALRLVRMYSFVGDTVLDPFLGTGTTSIAALKSGRNSIGYEIEPTYLDMVKTRFAREMDQHFNASKIMFDSAL